MGRGLGARGAAVAACVVVLGASGCGEKKSAAVTSAPTVSMWVSGTTADYRQVAGGVKLALAEAGGRAGAFRVNYAGRQVSDEPAKAVVDAVGNARVSLRDTQVSAVVTDAPADAARPAITLLNEAGVSAVALGDDALKREACSAESDIYPAGHATAIVIDEHSNPPAGWNHSFKDRLGFAPTSTAWRAYTGAKAVLASLAGAGVATDDDPPRLNRDALAAELVRQHGDCD